jgi:hypothetical protein
MSGEADLGEVLERVLMGLKNKTNVTKIAGEYMIDSKKKRKQVEEGIVDYIMDRLDIVREQKLPEQQILQQMRDLVWSFLVKHRLHHHTNL